MIDESDFRPSSPVPSDRWIFDGEKPFTDFGQWGEGRMDARVFEQAIWWVDVTGKPHLLTEMSGEYLQNVLNHIFQSVEYFYADAVLRHAIEMTMTVLPEFLEEGFVDYVDSKFSLHKMTPIQWMNDTVLIRKIIEILDGNR